MLTSYCGVVRKGAKIVKLFNISDSKRKLPLVLSSGCDSESEGCYQIVIRPRLDTRLASVMHRGIAADMIT